MTQAAFYRAVPPLKATLMAGLLAMAGCSGLSTPTAQSIQACRPRAA
jgi:hypothetical protein